MADMKLHNGNYSGGGGGGGSAEFPSGGTTGQALVKASGADNDVTWGTINGIPTGGGTKQILRKKSNADNDVEWAHPVQHTELPTANAGLAGTIFQYVGANTANRTNGYYYQCVLDSGSTYYWKQIDVQPPDVEELTTAEMNAVKAAFQPPVGAKANSGNPVGTVISYFGLTAPTGYLACDGSTYNRATYPALADHLIRTSVDFIGDGSTTFTVPDLRGEFLRGTGTNGHANSGDGAAVGVHQQATEIPNVFKGMDSTTPRLIAPYGSKDYTYPANMDVALNLNGSDLRFNSVKTGTVTEWAGTYMARPTNTSVLWCIKY